MRKYTHTEAFRYFGVEPTNSRWSWSARSEDDSVVVVTLWDHEFWPWGRYSYEDVIDTSRLGGREFRENLKWARDHCGGRVHVIRAFALDTKAVDLKIMDCQPASFTMLVTKLDLKTGAYRLEIELEMKATA